MKKDDFSGHKSDSNRKLRNMDVIRRMKEGDPLKSYESIASWYPPRPSISKDQDAMDKLYSGVKKSPFLQNNEQNLIVILQPKKSE